VVALDDGALIWYNQPSNAATKPCHVHYKYGIHLLRYTILVENLFIKIDDSF
jgi:hypothetical protein